MGVGGVRAKWLPGGGAPFTSWSRFDIALNVQAGRGATESSWDLMRRSQSLGWKLDVGQDVLEPYFLYECSRD